MAPVDPPRAVRGEKLQLLRAGAEGCKLIPESLLAPGTQYCIAEGSTGHLGVYRIECQLTPGHGGLSTSGLGSNAQAKEPLKLAFDFFKANLSRIAGQEKFSDHDFHLHVVELQNVGYPTSTTIAGFVGLCSSILRRPLQPQLVILGDISLGGSPKPVANLADHLQTAFDAGAKRLLLPMSNVSAIATVPGELFAKFQTAFYQDPTDAVVKVLGME